MARVGLEAAEREATRFRPPQLRRDLVPRPRLCALLDGEAGRRLTLVSAPAGFGKSTLLAEWAAAAARPVAWLSLDESDADPDRFAADVAEALAREDRPAALVLDGYERIAGPAGDESIRRLLEDARAPRRLVLAGRVDPALPLGALRARGELLELRAGDLRMSDAEASELLHRALGHSLAVREVLRRIDSCEGRPAALRLAAGVGDGDPGEHVLDEIRAVHPDELDFLVRTSVLDELSGPSCDAVLATSGSAETLRRIEHADLLVEPVDGVGERYRLHGELRRALQAELERTAPELVPALQLRAAAWLRRTGREEDAIEHALLGGGHAEAGRAIGRSWRRLVDEGEQARVLGWIDRLPDEHVAGDLRLGLVRAWLLALEGRRDESEASLEGARRAAGARALRGSVGREGVLLHCVVPWDDVGSALVLARRARRIEQTGLRRALAAWAYGWTSWWSGDLESAAEALDDVAGAPLLVRCAAQAVRSRIELERGREERALELARAADRTLRTEGLADLRELGMVATALGAAEAAVSPGSGALAQLERGIRLRRGWGNPLETADALIAAAPAAAFVLGRRQAATLLAEARRVVAGCADPGVLEERLRRAERSILPSPDRLRSDPVLSERELAVLRLLADGRSKREIGVELYLSFNAVHSHTKAIYRKLGVSSRGEAVARAHELGVG
ncbi:MAG TPA: LuxR C-terminal-related transcriptional regulator [Gaiellaceae bacterium]|nr:LuxR C-terminal-related transcriptional regulator [Gaiellaceae bacterium]